MRDAGLDCAAADAAAKRHDHELFEAQERTGLNGTRACSNPNPNPNPTPTPTPNPNPDPNLVAHDEHVEAVLAEDVVDAQAADL